ncbi:MAG: diadenylate cyclase [Acidobacteria bacterium]|nr:diadenylate cyclase [Acidobacteriota bacterium]
MGEERAAVGIEALGQVSVNVKQLPRAVAFYRDALELPLVLDTPGMAFFQCGATRLMLSVPTGAEFDHPGSVLYLTVRELPAPAALHRAAGRARPVHGLLPRPRGEHAGPDVRGRRPRAVLTGPASPAMAIPGLDAPIKKLIDIGLVAVLAYFVIVGLKGAKSRLALAGLTIVSGVYLLARLLRLPLTAWVLQGFIALFVVIIVVVFQEDIRRVFERIATLGLRRDRPVPGDDTIAVIARSVFELARARCGLLLVLPGEEPLERHLEGGTPLDALLSDDLIQSLFEPRSTTHDGAVVIEGNRAKLFGAHLPLSQDFDQLARRGTRHAAALGLAERTDALAIIVSEERGQVSVAFDGRLAEIHSRGLLESILRRFAGRASAIEAPRRGLPALLRQRGREILLALSASFVLWLLVVPGSETAEATFAVPVMVENLPPGYELLDHEPREVRVTVAGLRRDLVFLQPNRLRVGVDAFLVQLGRRSFEIPVQSVRRPAAFTVIAVEPERVTVKVRETR